MAIYSPNEFPEINRHLKKHNLDIRSPENKGRTFMDQKVTLDVLCITAECIIEHLKKKEEPFTEKDIRFDDYSKRQVPAVFGKPEIGGMAENEYNKFFAQPLKMLGYARILNEAKVKGKLTYTVENRALLEFIAMKERNALIFIIQYLGKVLKDSDLSSLFDGFFKAQDKASFDKLREGYIKYINTHTPKKKSYEPRRIFTKVLNPLALANNKLGVRGGFLSDSPILLSDIQYNRENWRDALDKAKHKNMSRSEFRKFVKQEVEKDSQFKYSEDKAKKIVRELHPFSEVHNHAIEKYKATYLHHIFPKSDFPELAGFPENIIALTSSQHYSRAHPDGKTRVVDPEYQRICLLSKLDSIEENVISESGHYSKSDFIQVLNTGFNTDIFDERGIDFEVLKHRILQFNK